MNGSDYILKTMTAFQSRFYTWKSSQTLDQAHTFTSAIFATKIGPVSLLPNFQISHKKSNLNRSVIKKVNQSGLMRIYVTMEVSKVKLWCD